MVMLKDRLLYSLLIDRNETCLREIFDTPRAVEQAKTRMLSGNLGIHDDDIIVCISTDDGHWFLD